VTTAGVAIATAALFSMLAFQVGYQNGVRAELEQLGAHILVVPKGCPYDAASMALHGASWPCYLKSQYLAEVCSVPGVATAAPVFMAAVSEGDGNQVVYVGVQSNILHLKRAWKIKGAFPAAEGEVLAGTEAARRHGWILGARVELPGQPKQTATVTGVLEPTQGADDTFVYMPLPEAQRVFGHSNELTHILVRLADPQDLDRVVAQLRGCDAGLSMNIVPLTHIFATIQSLVASTRFFLGCLAAIALLSSAALVSNSLLMAVSERHGEMGVMRAVGASRADLVRLIWLETSQICVAGAAAGVLVAFCCSRTVEAWVRAQLPFSPTDTLIRWQWPIAATCLACALVIGSLAALLPAWRAAQTVPMEAMRASGRRA
jgi:putative ABC transport system permease protein